MISHSTSKLLIKIFLLVAFFSLSSLSKQVLKSKSAQSKFIRIKVADQNDCLSQLLVYTDKFTFKRCLTAGIQLFQLFHLSDNNFLIGVFPNGYYLGVSSDKNGVNKLIKSAFNRTEGVLPPQHLVWVMEQSKNITDPSKSTLVDWKFQIKHYITPDNFLSFAKDLNSGKITLQKMPLEPLYFTLFN